MMLETKNSRFMSKPLDGSCGRQEICHHCSLSASTPALGPKISIGAKGTFQYEIAFCFPGKSVQIQLVADPFISNVEVVMAAWEARLWTSIAIAVFLLAPARALGQSAGPRFINPPGLVTPTGYTHVVVSADGRTAYIAGQVAFDSTGAVVGVGDFKAQAEQVFGNLRKALASVGATFADVMKMNTFVTDIRQVAALREIRSRYLNPQHPPANTLVAVAALARPEFMLEIEAVVSLPAGGR
jgi:enamine deaminase RidA (YjgF/YER057c/UK114 family)